MKSRRVLWHNGDPGVGGIEKAVPLGALREGCEVEEPGSYVRADVRVLFSAGDRDRADSEEASEETEEWRVGVLEPTVFDLSREGREGVALPELDVPRKPLEELLPRESLRQEPPGLPELSEPEVVRHFVHISSFNHHIDRGFYPLGSCTMKYNPKVNEVTARLFGFAHIHPQSPSETVQGALRLMHELADLLCRISGLDEATLQPAAGAHGELAGLMMIRAYHEKQGRARSTVLIPDSSHGTNPASVTLAGYRAVQVSSNEHGLVDIDDLRRVTDEEVAALMLTNPNTLGLFESEIEEIERIVHGVGAQLYMDGANLNALLGIVRPGDMGFDVVHFNLHKTFSTPHGGGGPGSGPVGVKSHIAPFLPVPVVVRGDDGYHLEYDRPDSIGKIQAFYGNFAVMVRAYTYIRMMGAEGLRAVSENAIINANYLKQRLAGTYVLPYPQHCQHEFVLSGARQKEQGVKTLDIAKRLLDFGVHAPTVYFPLIVPEALMIEPTETESKESLDHFVGAMLAIAEEVSRDPERVRTAPHTTPVGRLDEAGAGRRLDVRWRAGNAL